MFFLLIDTCVWLDLGKDQSYAPILDALEHLLKEKRIALVLPRTITEEFQRNKGRVVKDASRSMSSTLKRVKELVYKFGDPKQKNLVLAQLNDVDHKLPSLGDNVLAAMKKIEAIFAASSVIEITDDVKLRCAQRAIDRKAPFHDGKNSIGDAILFETYIDIIKDNTRAGNRFAFVTHNVKDFSQPGGSHKLPHPDLAGHFSKIKSLYFISLADCLRRIEPALLSDLIFEHEWFEEPRRQSEILEAMDLLFHQVWFNRHQVTRQKIERGKIKIVEKEIFPVKDHTKRPIQRDVWEMAQKAAERVLKQYGKENLGPWDDFEWGMINGKLSALRWVLGDEWDMLDT